MSRKISRRTWLGLAAGATAATLPGRDWIFGLAQDGSIVKAAAKPGAAAWKPVFFTRRQAEGIAVLTDAIIPRTDTPGARDARVHEYIDLALSLDSESTQERFRTRLKWMEKRAKRLYKKKIGDLSPEECAEFLAPLSDEHDKHPDDLKEGAALFRDLKSRTVFGYYTSREGRVEELGLPAEVGMETWRGCTHPDGHRRTG